MIAVRNRSFSLSKNWRQSRWLASLICSAALRSLLTGCNKAHMTVVSASVRFTSQYKHHHLVYSRQMGWRADSFTAWTEREKSEKCQVTDWEGTKNRRREEVSSKLWAYKNFQRRFGHLIHHRHQQVNVCFGAGLSVKIKHFHFHFISLKCHKSQKNKQNKTYLLTYLHWYLSTLYLYFSWADNIIITIIITPTTITPVPNTKPCWCLIKVKLVNLQQWGQQESFADCFPDSRGSCWF